jgi:hypothetical protein
MGAVVGATFSADSLGVAAPMRPVFERLMNSLAKRGLLTKVAADYCPTPAFATAANSAQDATRAFVARHSGHLPEALLCAGNCAELGPILRGEKDAVQVLFAGAGAELLDQFYGDGLYTSQWLAAISAAVQEAAHGEAASITARGEAAVARLERMSPVRKAAPALVSTLLRASAFDESLDGKRVVLTRGTVPVWLEPKGQPVSVPAKGDKP